MPNILVIVALENELVPESALELAAAARQLAGDAGSVAALLPGRSLAGHATELSKRFDQVFVMDHEGLAVPDGDLYADLTAPIVRRETPDLILMAHTNFAMDMVPRLATALDRPLLTDCLALEISGDDLTATRTMYAGKVHARLQASLAHGGCIATVRPGSYESADSTDAKGEIVQETLPADLSARRRFVRTVKPEAEDVDISQAGVLVAVGRGIDDGDNMEIIHELANALGAEVACSRPVVDKGWLPKTRQVGTSGVTVRPRVYMTIGISGSFQHMGGVKGGPFVVAVNSDPRAPIFSEADVGIVGDLFDIVPVLTEKIKAVRG